MLELGVFEVPQQFSVTMPPNLLCDLVGHPRSINIALAEAFAGNEWDDVAGYRHFLAAPEGLYSIDLPSGWHLISERDVEESPTGRWERTYAASAGATPNQTLVVYQSFQGPVEVTGGDQQSTVDVSGITGTLFRDAVNGELVLVWSRDGDGFALVGYESRFSPDDLIGIAASATKQTDPVPTN